MRGAFGKPQGTVARVRIGQPIMSVRSSDRYKAQVVEALRRAKFKFPGRQKVKFDEKLFLLELVIDDISILDLHLEEMGLHKIRPRGL